jgi:restriction system protein
MNADSPLAPPTFDKLMMPTLRALQALGGSAHVGELVDWIATDLRLSEDQMMARREGANANEVAYRAAWARTYLRKCAAIESAGRGLWSITPYGASITESEIPRVLATIRSQRAADASAASKPESEDRADDPDEIADTDWKATLLACLHTMSSSAFERLAQRVLREAGFVKVEVTGRSGDGGIDGIGVLRINLISFQVLFQCKRYRETVGAGEIRNFRGAMVGRSDKALFITTGRFTPDARREATRDGAPPVELIDGDTLCDLLKQYEVGVSTEMVERVRVDASVFETI